MYSDAQIKLFIIFIIIIIVTRCACIPHFLFASKTLHPAKGIVGMDSLILRWIRAKLKNESHWIIGVGFNLFAMTWLMQKSSADFSLS